MSAGLLDAIFATATVAAGVDFPARTVVLTGADARSSSGWRPLTASELQAISQKSCSVLNTLGPQIQWVHSYVTADQIVCVYRAPNEQIVREHARQGGFPADRISEIKTLIDPTTAE